MESHRVLVFEELPWLERGPGVRSKPLVRRDHGSEHLTTGVSDFAPGAAVAPHRHNCDESVVVLEGEATAEVNGRVYRLGPGDTAFIRAGVPHRFMNRGDRTLRFMWIYAAGHVTRTFVETGQTFDHGSPGDRAVVTPGSG
jgi:quercetin dioxygenase-like cupin family protein